MPLPAAWPRRTVVCTLAELNEPGSASAARVEFIQTGNPWTVVDGVLIAPATITAEFTNGTVSVDLPRTDVPDAVPAGRTWTATIIVGQRRHVRQFGLPAGDGPLNLAKVANVIPLGQMHRLVATVNGIGPDEYGNVDVDGGMNGSGPGGVTDHGALTGLADDDHPHYLTTGRGDTRYYPRATVDTALAGKEAAGAAAAAVAAHLAAADPHSQYTTDTELATALAGKADTGHTHPYSAITGTPTIPDSPDDIGAAPAAHTHPQSDVTGLAATLADLQAQIDALPGGGGTTIRVQQAYLTAGNVSPLPDTAGGWQPLAGFDLTIPAAVGDYVDLSVHAMRNANPTAFLDAAVVVDGAIVRYLATGGPAPAVEGDPGWYASHEFPAQSGPRGFIVTAGDVDEGAVHFVIAVKAQGAGILYASSDFPFYWRATNLGATA